MDTLIPLVSQYVFLCHCQAYSYCDLLRSLVGVGINRILKGWRFIRGEIIEELGAKTAY